MPGRSRELPHDAASAVALPRAAVHASAAGVRRRRRGRARRRRARRPGDARPRRARDRGAAARTQRRRRRLRDRRRRLPLGIAGRAGSRSSSCSASRSSRSTSTSRAADPRARGRPRALLRHRQVGGRRADDGLGVLAAHEHQRRDDAKRGDPRAGEERELEALGERAGTAAGAPCAAVRVRRSRLAIVPRTASPSAPPTCCDVLIRPEARPESSVEMPLTAAIVTGHEREARGRPRRSASARADPPGRSRRSAPARTTAARS